LKLIPSDSDDARGIAAAVAQAEKAAGTAPALDNLSSFEGKTGAKKKPSQASNGPAAGVSGTVSVRKDLIGKIDPADTVFIFAQLPQGPKMPLASLRIVAKETPYHFTLDDSVRCRRMTNCSNHPEVTISARVSNRVRRWPKAVILQGKSAQSNWGRKV